MLTDEVSQIQEVSALSDGDASRASRSVAERRCLMRDACLPAGEVLSEDPERADGGPAEQQQQ